MNPAPNPRIAKSDPHRILNYQEFWIQLEFDASRWLQQSTDKTLRSFWIDGFIPEAVSNTDLAIEVTGRAWVAQGARDQTQFQFTARFPENQPPSIGKAALIRRLFLDIGQKTLLVELGGNESH